MYHRMYEGERLFLLVYVDDLLIASSNANWINQVKQGLGRAFELKDFGPAKYCLGIEIKQTEDEIALSQKGYALDVIRRFNMGKCNPISTPSELKERLTKAQQGSILPKRGQWPYRELIGALMYLAMATRPDIANTTAKLAQFADYPDTSHWTAAKRVLRYLQGTADHGLVFKRTGLPMVGYSDADWAGCIMDRRSFSGYVFILGAAAISWKSQKQRTVALSSTEAEYVSLSEAAKEALYLRRLLLELGLRRMAEVRLHVDNQGAQYLEIDPVHHARTKHIDIRHHFVREAVKRNILTLEYLPTERMLADIFTKALSKVKHVRFVSDVGLKPVEGCNK